MFKIIKSFWKRQDSLERKLFWAITIVVIIVATISAVFTFFESFSIVAALISFGCAISCIALAIVAYKTSMYNQCYLVMCCMLSCFLLPLLFFFCGGITSGMPLYYVASLALIAFAMRGKSKIIVFSVSIAVQLLTIFVAWFNPEMVLDELARSASYLDFFMSLLFSGITLFAVGSFSLWEYRREHEKNIRLLARLDYLSMRDSLTGLYNRRYILNYLENTVWRRRNDFYIALLDLDNFKQINSTYGHDFGDKAIITVGNALQNEEDESIGECIARFGSEKFIYIIRSESEASAYSKVENIRKSVRKLVFKNHPEISLTISGGIIPCGSSTLADVKHMLSKVDSLLVLAKNGGKNQIRNAS